MVVPVDIASVVACWCIPVEVYREEKQTGMPSYRLRGCQTNQGAQDGNHICPVQLSSAVRSASGRSFKVLRASRSSSTARTSSCRDNIHEPVENNEPTLSTLIWQMMELMETLKLWMLFQVISSPLSPVRLVFHCSSDLLLFFAQKKTQKWRCCFNLPSWKVLPR